MAFHPAQRRLGPRRSTRCLTERSKSRKGRRRRKHRALVPHRVRHHRSSAPHRVEYRSLRIEQVCGTALGLKRRGLGRSF